jgi:hypothetical protein
MALLAAAAPYLAVASTAIGVAGTVRAGQEAKIQGEIKARELREDANARQAESQREAIVRRRQGNFAASRARAVAAASGGGVSGTTAETLIERIDTQTDLNVMNALFEGSTVARGLRRGANVSEREGRSASRASYLEAAGTALEGSTNFYDKYGSRFKGAA